MFTFTSNIGIDEIYRLIKATRTYRSRLVELALLVPIILVFVMVFRAFMVLAKSAYLFVSNPDHSKSDMFDTLNGVSGFWVTLAITLLIGLPFTVWLAFKIYRDSRKLLSNEFLAKLTFRKYKDKLQSCSCTLDDAGVHNIDGDGAKATYLWPEFKSYIEDETLFFLVKEGKEPYLILSLSNVTDPNNIEAIKNLIRRHISN